MRLFLGFLSFDREISGNAARRRRGRPSSTRTRATSTASRPTSTPPPPPRSPVSYSTFAAVADDDDRLFASERETNSSFTLLRRRRWRRRRRAEKPGVVSVFPNRGHKLHTTRSWQFLGLAGVGGAPTGAAWKKARFGEDTIIGNLDTGNTIIPSPPPYLSSFLVNGGDVGGGAAAVVGAVAGHDKIISASTPSV